MKLNNQNFQYQNINSANIKFKADMNNFNDSAAVQPIYAEDIELPDMYYIPENYKKEKSVLDTIKKFDLFGIIKAWTEHPLLMVGTCAGMSLGIDAFDKSCGKEYDKSIVGKAAKFGDNIEQSKFVKNDNTQKVLTGVKKAWVKTKDFAMKNDVINAMFTTPSQPEWSAPKDELKNTNYRIVSKFKELVGLMDMMPAENGIDNAARKNFTIKDLALDKNEIEELKEFYKVEKLSQAPQEELPYRVMLKRIGKSEQEITNILSEGNISENVSKELFKKSGLTKAELELILRDETGETIELVKKASGNLKGTKITNGKLVLPGTRQPFANVESFENIYNRAHSLTDGAKTKTGRFMSKLVQKIHRGFTWGNKKTGVMLLVAPFFMETIVNTKKADKGEKVGTAVSGLINAISWVFTFPIALRMIHAYGGIQYAGMGKEKVETYKKLVNEFNEKVKNNDFKDISTYRAEKKALKKQLKALRNVKNQNLLTETLRGISKFSKADLLKIESYQGGSITGNLLRKLPNVIKDYLIYAPGRMIVFMLVGVGLVDKVINKILSKIFGTAYDGMKDDEMHDEKEKQEEFTINDLRTRLIDVKKNTMYPQDNAISDNLTKNSLYEPKIPESMTQLALIAGQNKINTPAENSELKIAEHIPEELIEDVPFEDIPSDTSTENTDNTNQQNNTEEITDKPEIITAESAQENINPFEQEVTTPANINSEESKPETKVNALPYLNNTDNNSDIRPELYNETLPVNSNIGNVPVPALVVSNKRDNYTYIPSQENILAKDNPITQVNKYIPAQTGIKINKYFDNSALEAAIRRSYRAEQRALKVLAGDFDNQ